MRIKYGCAHLNIRIKYGFVVTKKVNRILNKRVVEETLTVIVNIEKRTV
jgi:hypothetical protein